MASPLDPEDEQRFIENVQKTAKFFMGDSDVHRALHDLTRILDEEKIPYAIAGAIALNEHGFVRATVDIDVLITREGLAKFKERHLGRGYVEKFPGSKGVRETRHNVLIDFLLTGDYPGDGKPKPISFPDPATVAERGGRFALVPLKTFIELKIASGITAPHRPYDLGDVMNLIKARSLPEAFVDQLDPYVREKYRELWKLAQIEEDY